MKVAVRMNIHLRQREISDTTESGFVLVLALVVLLMLSLLGIWALQTSTSELNVAGGSLQVERQFNISEGGANSEAGKIGFVLQPFYQISNPSIYNQLLTPTTDITFDPGNDTATTLAGIATGDVTTWPWENLWPLELPIVDEKNLPTHNDLDYRYLTTYLHPDTAPIGYDPNFFSGYKFRIQSGSAFIPVVVELGGTKVGVKSSL